MVDLAANIWGDGPSSQPKEPNKRDIRAWGAWIEAFVKGVGSTASRVYLTLADMNADAAGNPPEENAQLGWVVADPDTTKSGIYQWYAGMTKWQYIAPLPYSFIPAEDSGEGTPNAIKATSPVPVSGMALVLLNVYEANTGSPVTVQFNGGPVLTIKTNTGQDVAAGGLPAGVVLLGRQVGSKFQLVSDQASAALASAAQAAQAAAELARDMAVTAASGVQSEQPSRAYAAANYHPLVGPDFIRTAAYAVAGDFGGALYKRVSSQPTHQGKFSITLAGSGTVVWYELAELNLTPFMLGAKGDDPGDGTGTDDRAAFQNALDINRFLIIPGGRKYRIGGPLQVPRFPQILGPGSRTASEYLTDFKPGAPVLVFSGSGAACMVNQDPTTMMSHGKIGGFSLRCNGTYAWMMDFRTCVDMIFEEIRMQTDSTTTNGFRSQKIAPSDDSWLNSMQAVSVRLPDASTGRTFDVDWSDSPIDKSQFTGGVGAIDRGYGLRIVNSQFERSSYIGLTILKAYATKMTIVSACQFDANKTHGLAVDVTGDTSGQTWIDITVVNNDFRTVDPNTGSAGSADIALINPTGATYYGGAIGPNSHIVTTVPMKVETGSWALAKFVGAHVRDMTTIPWAADDPNFWADARGINVPKGIVAARGSRNVLGYSNVAGFFGNATLGDPGVVMGAIPGVGPFIGASLDNSLAAKPLLIYTGNVERLRVAADGSSLRPAGDNVTDLGQAANRMRTIYAGTAAISTSDEDLKADITAIPDAALDAWEAVEWCQFRFTDGKRLHTGLIAQRVHKAFADKGLDAFAYGLLCFDEWDDEFEEHEVQVVNEDGTPKMKTRKIKEKHNFGGQEVTVKGTVDVPVVKKTKVKVREAGSRWGVRYEEALAMEAALMRRTINRLSKSS